MTTRNYGNRDRILQFMEANPNVVYTTRDVMTELGMPGSTVSTSLGRLAEDGSNGVESLSRGSWICRTKGKKPVATGPAAFDPQGEYFTKLGTTSDGDVLVQGEDNTIYQLLPVRIAK